MDIFINDKLAEITLDSEKTLGDVMTGIEQWISPTGNRIQKIAVNSKELPLNDLSEAFGMNTADIKRLDIHICAWRELASEALEILYETCLVHKNASFDERKRIFEDWGKSAGARFLNSDIRDIFNLAELVLSGNGISVSDFIAIVEERFREVADPNQETVASEAHVKIISQRMEELPLDLQTGKDQRAAETVQLFSQISGKLFRLFFIYKSEGLSMDDFIIGELPARAFIEEFNSALRELSTAYENRDIVLAGDIAEYELAPRLVNFFDTMKKMIKSRSQVISEP